MKCTITREGNIVVQSESESEDFALRGYCEMNRQRLEQAPILFCFDHRQDFDSLVAASNKEAEELGRQRMREVEASKTAAEPENSEPGK